MLDKIFKGLRFICVSIDDVNCTGYNCTIFAYGQTGSGKTYTMGTEETTTSVVDVERRGIIPRLLDAVFTQIKQHTDSSVDSVAYSVTCSMLEVRVHCDGEFICFTDIRRKVPRYIGRE